ncbi:MAG: hypothetical protein ACE5G8_08230 [Anaerolineae bacterium]
MIFGGLAGAIGLGGVGLVVCLAVVFVCASGLFVTLSAASSGLAIRSENPHRFVGVFTTLHDAGLAAGPLLAYSAGGLLGLPALYMLGAGLLALPVWQFWRVEGERERRLRQAN